MSMVIDMVVGYLLWTLGSYWLHRLAHVHSPRNPLWQIHRHHHRFPYLEVDANIAASESLGWRQRFFQIISLGYFTGDVPTTVDVLVTLTAPLLLVCTLLPGAMPLIPLHFAYEAWLSEGLLEHNRRLRGVRLFAVGSFHLWHHAPGKIDKNYGLSGCALWDYVFGTAEIPPPSFPRAPSPRVSHDG